MCVLSSWRTPLQNTCKAPRISIKRQRRHGCEGVARLELTERVRRVAHLRNLLEPAAGGRGVAETAGESTRATSSTPSARPVWPPCGAQVSGTSCPCALRCLSYPLADLSHACGRPRTQELVSEASWHLLFTRRASKRWSWNFSKGSPMSAMRSRGGLRMSGMGASDICEDPCSFVHAVCVLASASSRKCHCGFSWRFVGFVTFVISVVPACHVESISIA